MCLAAAAGRRAWAFLACLTWPSPVWPRPKYTNQQIGKGVRLFRRVGAGCDSSKPRLVHQISRACHRVNRALDPDLYDHDACCPVQAQVAFLAESVSELG